MNRAIHLIAAAITAVAVGCSPTPEPGNDRAESELVAREVGASIAEVGGAIATLADPLARAMADDGDAAEAVAGEPVAADSNGALRARIEAALDALVGRADCLSIDWTLLRATVGFDDCNLPETDATLDGEVGLAVRPLLRAVTLTADELTLGANRFHGSITAYLRGPIGDLTVGVDADVTLASSSATLIVSGLTVDASIDGVTLSGTGSVISPKVDADASADALFWGLGDCAPTAGSVSYIQGALSGTIRFLDTTPATGEVELHIPPFPPQVTALLPPCE